MGVTTNQDGAKTWRDLFLGREMQAVDLFARLATRIAASVPRTNSRASRLGKLAEVISELPEITGAMIVACEEGFPLAYGAANISLRNDSTPFTTLENIQKAVPEESIWITLPLDQIEAPGAKALSARRILDDGVSLGAVLVGLLANRASSLALDGLSKGLEHLKWVIREALQLEKMRLIEELRVLELEELGRTKPIEPETIANRLEKIFRADAVTILAREQERLFLSATTDSELGNRVFSYEPGEGLTGYVFSTGTPFRLRNAHDNEEVRLQSGGNYLRGAPYHPENILKSGKPVRCLAVPMLSGRKVRGIIRILREESAEPFSAAEQKSLQHFANLLGLAMHTSWRLFLADHVMEAETEAICITRSEPAKGHSLIRIVRANLGAETLFNLRRDQIIGRDATGLYHSDEYKKIKEALERAAMEGKNVCGPIRTRINRFNTPPDDFRSVEISFRLLASPFVKPDTHYTIAVIRDTTDSQMKADQHKRLMTLLTKKGLAYFRADKNDRTVESSLAELKLTSYSSQELQRMGREQLYLDPRDRHSLLRAADRQDGQLVYTTQLLKRKDGTPFWAEGVIHLLKNADGKSAGYEGLYEDVTERLRLQGFLDADTEKVLKDQELYKKLEENVRFQLLFMTSVSHQLRSPLGALVEQLINIQEGIADSSRFTQRLKYVIGQAKVCALLVANLTYMDKILRGESFEFKRVRLAKLATETKLHFEHLALDKNITIDVDSASLDRNLEVWGHPELLRQVFVNLVDNAIKYSIPGSYIRICGRDNMQGRFLQIVNRGLPIPRQDRDRIFERGFRTQEAEALIPAGTGLGLWLVRKICSAHSADIRCTVILEGGEEHTAFQVFFPSKNEGDMYRRRFT